MQSTSTKPHIAILGGGTAGWMTAAALARHFGDAVSITAIASQDIPTVGVGEATIPTLRQFYAQLGLSDSEVLSQCSATSKLGIEFHDWQQPGSAFFHPFGLFGQTMAGVEFQHYWHKQQQQSQDSLADYSLACQLAKAHRFALPAKQPKSELSVFDWALHIDATQFAHLMKKIALDNGVTFINDTVTWVELNQQSGDIQQLHLNEHAPVSADLFVDCSGFRSQLLGEAMKTGFVSWQHWLYCDNAWAVQREAESALPPFTKVTARTAGWRWDIPLQARYGSGQVYASTFQSSQAALDDLLANLGSKAITEPRALSFTPGRRTVFWQKNCVAIGLAGGFLEPLESTSIALIQTGIERLKYLVKSFPVHDAVRHEFNQTTTLEYERVRDFLILHYKLNQRDDSEFWRACRAMRLPDSLAHKLDIYQATGTVVNDRWDIFNQPSWLAIYHGFKVLPQRRDMRLDSLISAEKLDSLMQQIKQRIRAGVDDAFDHADFIRQHGQTPATRSSYASHF